VRAIASAEAAGPTVLSYPGETTRDIAGSHAVLASLSGSISFGEDDVFNTADEVLSYIKKEGVEMVRRPLLRPARVMQHFTVPVSSFDAEVFSNGLGFDGSSIRASRDPRVGHAPAPGPDHRAARPVPHRKTLILNFFIHTR